MTDYSKYTVITEPWGGEWRVMCDNTEGRTYPHTGTAECAMSKYYDHGTPLSEALIWITTHQATQHGPKGGGVSGLQVRVTVNRTTDKLLVQLAGEDRGLSFELDRIDAAELHKGLAWALQFNVETRRAKPEEGHGK